MVVVPFPGMVVTIETCRACGRPTPTHVLRGRWIGCQRDVVIGRDQVTRARRLRLARLQRRMLRVQPFGIGVDGMDAR